MEVAGHLETMMKDEMKMKNKENTHSLEIEDFLRKELFFTINRK